MTTREITVHIPTELKTELESVADKSGIGVNEVVHQAISTHVGDLRFRLAAEEGARHLRPVLHELGKSAVPTVEEHIRRDERKQEVRRVSTEGAARYRAALDELGNS